MRPRSLLRKSWKVTFFLSLLACSLPAAPAADRPLPSPLKLTDRDLERIRDGFEARRDAMLKRLAGQPFVPAEKKAPLAPGRPPYTRGYGYSVTDFAMRSFWLGEQLPAANAAIQELCRYFIANPAVGDDYDNFYWWADVLDRMVEFFGHSGSRQPGRLTRETEDLVLEMMWTWAKKHSRTADAETEQSGTWFVWGSENHHLQRFSTCWHFAKFLKDDPRYRDRPYDDGQTAAAHHAAWTAFAKEYLRQRAMHSLFVEIANGGYGFASLKGVYNIYDFADDPVLKRRAGYLLDLYWATWAEEQIDRVRGGGKARIYPGRSSSEGLDNLARVAWYYFGTGDGEPPRANDFTPITSGYRLPLVVMDIALDPAGRGVYETRQYPLGLAVRGYNTNAKDYRLRTDSGGIYRYSFCTPEFIMGTTMFAARPLADWTNISSQNRWQGVIFAGHPDARIFPQCRALSRNRQYNTHWSVQAKGTLVTQKLKTNLGAAEMRVWFSGPGLTGRVEKDGWVFVEAPGAYAAVRPVTGGYAWQDPLRSGGQWLRCKDEWTPVIIEVVRKSDLADYATFQARVLANPLKFENQVLRYETCYGDTLTFFADASRSPQINGRSVSYSPGKSFDSPFVQSLWRSGVVTIAKGDRRLVLDFNR